MIFGIVQIACLEHNSGRNERRRRVEKKSTGIQKKHSILQDYFKCRYLFLLLLPTILYFIIFHYVPMYGITIAFKEFYPTKGIMGSEWVGFKHFEKLFTGRYFFQY